MPTYEYRCRVCGHAFDIVQAMSDEALTACPVCGGELRKVFAAPAISFKGSGFYATDHGKKSRTTSEGSGADAGGEKPAASTETTAPSGKKDGANTPAPKDKAPTKDPTTSGVSSSGSKRSAPDGKGA